MFSFFKIYLLWDVLLWYVWLWHVLLWYVLTRYILVTHWYSLLSAMVAIESAQEAFSKRKWLIQCV